MNTRNIEVDEVIPKGGSSHRPLPGDDPLIRFLAKLLDTQFVIPGTNIRFGLDPLIGLLPAFGDSTSALLSAGLILMSARHGVPRIVLARMAFNVLINTAVGAIPVVGDLFSVWFKSNALNYALLQRHAGTRRTSTTGDWLFVAGLLLGLLAIAILSLAFTFALATRLYQILFKPGA